MRESVQPTYFSSWRENWSFFLQRGRAETLYTYSKYHLKKWNSWRWNAQWRARTLKIKIYKNMHRSTLVYIYVFCEPEREATGSHSYMPHMTANIGFDVFARLKKLQKWKQYLLQGTWAELGSAILLDASSLGDWSGTWAQLQLALLLQMYGNMADSTTLFSLLYLCAIAFVTHNLCKRRPAVPESLHSSFVFEFFSAWFCHRHT